MPTTDSLTHEFRVAFTDIDALMFGSPLPGDEACAGDLYLSLTHLTAANDVRIRPDAASSDAAN